MRAFGNFEKQLINKMIELDEEPDSLNVLGNILDTFYGESNLPQHCYIKLMSEKDVSIQIETEALQKKQTDLRSVDYNVSKKIIGVVALFEYLEEQKLAYFTGNLDLASLGTVVANVDYTQCEFLDDDLKPLIYKYSRKRIFISETLRLFVKSDYKTDEEIRHEKEMFSIGKQLKFTQLALVMTIISLFISILVPVLVISDIDIKNDHIVTELSEKTISKTSNAIKEGLIPIIEELKSTQEELEKISSSIKQTAKDDLLNKQQISRTIGLKLDRLSKSLTDSVEINDGS